MAIIRTIPDVRSTDIEKTARFYTGLLGFDTRAENGDVVSFVSATHEAVVVTLNRDGFALPPGFTVEVDAGSANTRASGRRPPPSKGSARTVREPVRW
jgi:catechol 2,3-dioxygenase-like lactoylglutathione lyase family enzyme